MHFMFLNGPKHTGKDTVASMLARQDNLPVSVHHLKFSAPLKRAIHALFGVEDCGDCERFSCIKDQERPEFLNHLLRDLYVSISEDYAKPRFGNDFFGHVMVNQIREIIEVSEHPKKLFVVSDSRFADELRPVIKEFGAENLSNFCLVKLVRQGYSFDDEPSGSYIDAENIIPVMGSYDISDDDFVSNFTEDLLQFLGSDD